MSHIKIQLYVIFTTIIAILSTAINGATPVPISIPTPTQPSNLLYRSTNTNTSINLDTVNPFLWKSSPSRAFSSPSSVVVEQSWSAIPTQVIRSQATCAGGNLTTSSENGGRNTTSGVNTTAGVNGAVHTSAGEKLGKRNNILTAVAVGALGVWIAVKIFMRVAVPVPVWR